MNNIIFRGWSPDLKEWILGYLIVSSDGQYYIVTNFDEWGDIESYIVLPESLAMYTGLKDKNGKRIFGSIPVDGRMSKGGDIIVEKNDHFSTPENPVWEDPMEVKWDLQDKLTGFNIESCYWDIKIIGTVFDNPELLEVE